MCRVRFLSRFCTHGNFFQYKFVRISFCISFFTKDTVNTDNVKKGIFCWEHFLMCNIPTHTPDWRSYYHIELSNNAQKTDAFSAPPYTSAKHNFFLSTQPFTASPLVFQFLSYCKPTPSYPMFTLRLVAIAPPFYKITTIHNQWKKTNLRLKNIET